MRKLWARVAYGRYTSQVEDVQESSVTTVDLPGGDPAPGYRWAIADELDYDGDLRITLERWTGKGWESITSTYVKERHDWSVMIPRKKGELWSAEQQNTARRRKNDAYLAKIKS